MYLPLLRVLSLAGKRPQSRSLATAVVLSPVYAAGTWQWVYMSQYSLQQNICCLLYTVSINVLKHFSGAQNFQMQQL
jgi:hypothetical protein